MKTCLMALFTLWVGASFGQTSDPLPTQTGTGLAVRTVAVQKQFQPSAQLPAGGFWVVAKDREGPAVAHFYADNGQELRADTLRQKFLNLKRRAVRTRLNGRLRFLLDEQPVSPSVVSRQP